MDISSNDLLYKPESVVTTRDLPSLGNAERGEVLTDIVSNDQFGINSNFLIY